MTEHQSSDEEKRDTLWLQGCQFVVAVLSSFPFFQMKGVWIAGVFLILSFLCMEWLSRKIFRGHAQYPNLRAKTDGYKMSGLLWAIMSFVFAHFVLGWPAK